MSLVPSWPDSMQIRTIICHCRGSDYPISHGFTKGHYIQCPIRDQAWHLLQHAAHRSSQTANLHSMLFDFFDLSDQVVQLNISFHHLCSYFCFDIFCCSWCIDFYWFMWYIRLYCEFLLHWDRTNIFKPVQMIQPWWIWVKYIGIQPNQNTTKHTSCI